jgi:hypothetical protein
VSCLHIVNLSFVVDVVIIIYSHINTSIILNLFNLYTLPYCNPCMAFPLLTNTNIPATLKPSYRALQGVLALLTAIILLCYSCVYVLYKLVNIDYILLQFFYDFMLHPCVVAVCLIHGQLAPRSLTICFNFLWRSHCAATLLVSIGNSVQN